MSTDSHPTSPSESTTNDADTACGTFSEATQRAIDERRELEHKNWLVRFVDWLRVGYPAGVPDGDAGAIMYVLKQELKDADIDRIAAVIVTKQESHHDRDKTIPERDVQHYIAKTMAQKPTEDDLARVRAKLREGGFTVAP